MAWARPPSWATLLRMRARSAASSAHRMQTTTATTRRTRRGAWLAGAAVVGIAGREVGEAGCDMALRVREHPLDERRVVLGDHAALLLEAGRQLVPVHREHVPGQLPRADLLEVRALPVALVHLALVERADARLVEQVAAHGVRRRLPRGGGRHDDARAVEGEPLLRRPADEPVEVGLDEAPGELAVRRDEERLAHEGGELEPLLHRHGRDLLA